MMRNLLQRLGLQRLESLVLALMIALPAGFLVFGESVAFASGYEEEEGESEDEEGDEHGARHPTPGIAPVGAAAARPAAARPAAAATGIAPACRGSVRRR